MESLLREENFEDFRTFILFIDLELCGRNQHLPCKLRLLQWRGEGNMRASKGVVAVAVDAIELHLWKGSTCSCLMWPERTRPS